MCDMDDPIEQTRIIRHFTCDGDAAVSLNQSQWCWAFQTRLRPHFDPDCRGVMIGRRSL